LKPAADTQNRLKPVEDAPERADNSGNAF